MASRILSLVLLLAPLACTKVPLQDINAAFTLADVTWFEEEETMFLFYRVEAEQGLNPGAQLEVTYRTDDVFQGWTPLSRLNPVHTHVAVDCGEHALCGSFSLHVSKPPRDIALQLRYDPQSELALGSSSIVNLVRAELGTHHRSLVVYGVFDANNTHVQWRARHQFPTLRNEQVSELGLRRYFQIAAPGYGDALLPELPENPYAYAFAESCPADAVPLAWNAVETTYRAVFDSADGLPLAASTSPIVCATSEVTDAKGRFAAPAIARKNPEVAPAFPVLRTPAKKNTELGFVLHPCAREFAADHLAYQEQRLLLQGAPEICLDAWQSPGFGASLASQLKTRIDSARSEGNDMVLALALHHDDTTGALAALIESALKSVLEPEQIKSSPRVSGAFVFDSEGHLVSDPDLGRWVLWCPAAELPADLDGIPNASSHACPILSDSPDLVLGPFKLNQIPVFATRAQYATFVSKYTAAEVGQVRTLTFTAPERTPISQNVPLGDFGTATFFNDESISASAADAFSYCDQGDPAGASVVFHSKSSSDPRPLSELATDHAAAPDGPYALGLAWDFPFLVKLDYENIVAGSATAFSFTVPFGIKSPATDTYGSAMWSASEFPLAKTLLRCTRFCDHPTFDSAGVFNVLSPFRITYATQCYAPQFPTAGQGGFPRDP